MNQRGIAMPMALLMLALLLTLMLAFATLTTTEPVIASNQTKSVLARGFAESGIARALWGLANPTASGGVPDSLGTSATGTLAASPYDGAVFVTVSTQGGFTLAVKSGATSDERDVVAVGWTPTNSAADTRTKGIRKIQTTLWRMTTPLCALCVSGELQVSGSVEIDARSGQCANGPSPTSGTTTTGPTLTSGNVKIYGPGNSTSNERPADIQENAASVSTLTSAQVAALKTLAQKNGTYYQGARSFSGSLPSGVVFVDTADGSEFSSSTSDSNAGNVTITGSTNWRGWLIAAGSITISGNADMKGLIYALNNAGLSGNVEISGAVIAENRKDASSTNVDSTTSGNVGIEYNCADIQNAGGTLAGSWFVKPGTYLEIAGQ